MVPMCQRTGAAGTAATNRRGGVRGDSCPGPWGKSLARHMHFETSQCRQPSLLKIGRERLRVASLGCASRDAKWSIGQCFGSKDSSVKGAKSASEKLRAIMSKHSEHREQVFREAEQRVLMDELKWGLRSAASVCFSAFLVLNGTFQAKSHGYGILVLITCINCSEQLQGDLMRKSLERFLGTSVGSLAAMCVLYLDDYLIPEKYGWYAREDFYLFLIGAFTMGGVLLRSRNKMKPLYDYSFFLCVASFDFLLLDAFKHTNPFGDGLYSIFMVVIGSLFTVSIGVFCFPQFAGFELAHRTADTLELAAIELEVTARMLIGCHSMEYDRPGVPSPGRCLSAMSRMRELAALALFEVRLVRPCQARRSSIVHQSVNVDWTTCLRLAEAAATVCEVCDTVQNVCEAEDAIWDINRLEGCAPCPCEELVLQVLCEAMEVVIYCEQALRSKKGVSPGKRCCRKQFREQLIAKYSSFQKALELLDRAIDDAASLWPNSLKYSAVRAMCVQLPARVFACVNAILRVAEEGILEEPIMASIC